MFHLAGEMTLGVGKAAQAVLTRAAAPAKSMLSAHGER
jgi:hypothetical protein